MPELVWVTQGKTEHLATLLGTLGAEGQEDVEIRWSSTQERAFVPVNTVRRDDRKPRRRTAPISYAESPALPRPREEEAVVPKATKGTRRKQEEDKPSRKHRVTGEENTDVGSKPPRKRLKGPIVAEGRKKGGEITNAPYETTIRTGRERSTEKKSDLVAISSQGLSRDKFVVPRAVSATTSAQNTVEKGRNTKGKSTSEPYVKNDNPNGTFIYTKEGRGGDIKETTSSSRFIIPRRPKAEANQSLTRQVTSTTPAASSETDSKHESKQVTDPNLPEKPPKKRPVEVHDIDSVKNPLHILPNPIESENQKASGCLGVDPGSTGVHQDNMSQPLEARLPSEGDNVANNPQSANLDDETNWSSEEPRNAHQPENVVQNPFNEETQDFEKNEAIHPLHVPLETDVEKPDDVSNVNHAERTSMRGRDMVCLKEPLQGRQNTTQMQPPSKQVVARVGLPTDIAPTMHTRNPEDDNGILDETIAAPANVHLSPVHPPDQSRNGLLSTAEHIELPPVAVVKETKGRSNDENNFFSSDDDALDVAVHRLKFGEGWRKEQNDVSMAEISGDDTDGLLSGGSEKNINNAPNEKPRFRFRPTTVKGKDYDASSSDDDAIVHSILHRQGILNSKKPSSPSLRGFEKELSKQQRLFLAEVSGDFPATSLKQTNRKNKSVRINKKNWNKIEKLKYLEGTMMTQSLP